MYSLKAIKFKTFVGLCRDMSSRKHVSNDEYLSPKMRLCLFYGSACNAEEALALQESDITPDFLMANGVKARNMSAAGVGPRFLKDMGVSDCAQLRTMGFDALDLADTKFASEACLAYGADQILDVFLTGASDAVAIAGSDTTHITGAQARVSRFAPALPWKHGLSCSSFLQVYPSKELTLTRCLILAYESRYFRS